MPDNINEEEIGDEQDQEGVQDDPVERLKERSVQSQLNADRAKDGLVAQAESMAGQLIGAGEGDGMTQKIKSIRNIIKIIKGGTAVGGGFGDILISIPTFLITGFTDLILSYVIPGWVIGKIDKLLTVLGLVVFGLVAVFAAALLMGAFQQGCIDGNIIEQSICSQFI